jgi:hypothetical protein
MPGEYSELVDPQLINLHSEEDMAALVNDQVRVANYRLPPLELPPASDREYVDNSQLWQDVLTEELRATRTLTLKNFLLFEWFPRSPGLYHTPGAREVRQTAMYFLVSSPRSSTLREIDDAEWMLKDPLAGPGDPVPDYMYIFNPYGKISMLKGGIGSIRLKPRYIDAGQVWFMTASSTPSAHEGFPVALPNHEYERHIDQIATRGVLPCTLIGKLQILPGSLSDLYQDYTNVPQVYLRVKKVIPKEDSPALQEITPRVSVAVSFMSDYEYPGHPQMYASYVTFFPGQKGSLENRAEWLENTYVKGLYQGRIITDFDEHSRRFANAVFGLKKINENRLNPEEIDSWRRRFGQPYVLEGLPERLEQIHSQSEQRRRGLRSKLFQAMGNKFVVEELKTVSSELYIDYENLPWETKDGLVRELVLACERQGLTRDLIQLCREKKPGGDWPKV